MFARLPLALHRFLRRPLTLPAAEEIVRRRMTRRDESFLRIVQRSVYAHERSPYLALLRHAGCEFGDLPAAVRTRGVEGALRQLRGQGVYVTYEEFKGRRPIVRPGLTLPVKSSDFDNPFARQDSTVYTGGSTGLATAVGQDLDYIAAGAPHTALMLEAYGLWDAPTLHWQNPFPGNGWRFIVQRTYLRQYARRWCTYCGVREPKGWFKYYLASQGMWLSLRVLGQYVPAPRFVGLEQADVIARWTHETLRAEGRCLWYTGVSRALRIARAAQDAGLDLTGTTARIGGEPVTAAKVEALARSGVRCLTTYGMNETGAIGIGCLKPAEVDDVHLLHDAFALITHPVPAGQSGVTVPAFNLTSLIDSSFKVMLNYETDDYGAVEERSCGCPLGSYGYTTHLHGIRSYSKLVGEGVSLVGNEILQILERVLPARFGGTLLDYQIQEEEDADGLTRLYLVVDPRIAIADDREVIDAFYAALRSSSPMADAARAVWQHAHSLRIRRQVPLTTARGKLLPLHVVRPDKGQ